ncbi:MAG TPA: phosphonate C-P lyase system protein PhnH [Mesorhizobium sp.]
MIAASATLEGGFADTVMDAQAAFRAVMNAMANPATVVAVPAQATPPAPLTQLAGSLACTLMDADTPVWLDGGLALHEAVRAWLGFHTGAPVAASPPDAIFALVADPSNMPALADFAQGTQEYPDRSATLVLALESLDGGAPLTFRGPGIDGEATFAPLGLPGDFADQWALNAARFPCGVDLILICGDRLACLPRSSRLVREGA